MYHSTEQAVLLKHILTKQTIYVHSLPIKNNTSTPLLPFLVGIQQTVFPKSPTTSSTGGLILALQRAILLLAPKGDVASTFTGPL